MASLLAAARRLVQMRTDRIEPMVAIQSPVRISRLQPFQDAGGKHRGVLVDSRSVGGAGGDKALAARAIPMIGMMVAIHLE